MDDRLTQLAEEASAALRDDPELRLEVKAELAAHLEETAHAFTEDGNDEAESIALAVKAFGPAPEVAQQLLAANQRRMKLRALARLVLRAAIIPAAVILAIVIGCGRLVNLGNTLRLWHMLGGLSDYSGTSPIPDLPNLPFTLSYNQQLDRLQEKFIFGGDQKRGTRYEQQRAIWEAHPDNKVYLGNYVSALMMGAGLDHSNLSQRKLEMRQGEKLDPDNAIYNYCLAYALGVQALEQTFHRRPPEQDPPGSVNMNNTVFILHNRQQLDQAMAEFRRGLTKPILTAYHQQMLQEQLATLPDAGNFSDATLHLAVSAWVLLPEYARYRYFARAMPYYGQLLLSEGRRQEAAVYLDGWQRLPVQILRGEDSLIGMLVAAACAKITGEGAAEVYEHNGEPERARQIRVQLARFLEPSERLGRSEDIQPKAAGLFTKIFPGHFGQFIRPGELIPPHRLEYTITEEAALSLLVLLLLLMLVIEVMTWLPWWLVLRKEGNSPLLLLPSARNSLRILLLGFGLPLAVYVLYTRLPLAGRDQSLLATWPRAGIEILLLGVLLLALPSILLVREVRRRCRQTGIPVPAPLGNWDARLIAWGQGAAILLFVVGFAFLNLVHEDWWIRLNNVAFGGLILGGAVVVFGVILGLGGGIAKFLTPARRFGVYFGSVARTLVPLYAVMVILLSGLVYPLLVQEEAYWIRRDTLIFRQKGEETISMTPLEDRTVTELKRQMLQTPGAHDTGFMQKGL